MRSYNFFVSELFGIAQFGYFSVRWSEEMGRGSHEAFVLIFSLRGEKLQGKEKNLRQAWTSVFHTVMSSWGDWLFANTLLHLPPNILHGFLAFYNTISNIFCMQLFHFILFWGYGNWTKGLAHTRQVYYPRDILPHPSFLIFLLCPPICKNDSDFLWVHT